MTDKSDIRYGWKFLDPTGCTYHDGATYQYDLPRKGEKYGPANVHPNPAAFDGRDCGPGRYHLMTSLSAEYAPSNWWPWFARCKGIVGESEEKFGATEVQLRRVSPHVFWRIIRLGWCSRANLYGANLTDANLTGANLTRANLYDANLTRADLTDADLTRANLYGANLYGANLTRADLRNAIGVTK